MIRLANPHCFIVAFWCTLAINPGNEGTIFLLKLPTYEPNEGNIFRAGRSACNAASIYQSIPAQGKICNVYLC
jgi:hypothetical protein